MVGRVLIGQQPNGEYGLWLSKPGYEVVGVQDYNCQFSSNFAHLRLIAAGQTAVDPTGEDNGETTVNIYFDKSYSEPLPFVVAMAKASDWTLGLHTNDGGGLRRQGTLSQYTYLNGVWITRVLENQAGAVTQEYSPSGATQVGRAGSSANIKVPASWAAIKFETRIYNSFVQFAACNTYQPVFIKYLIYDPTTG